MGNCIRATSHTYRAHTTMNQIIRVASNEDDDDDDLKLTDPFAVDDGEEADDEEEEGVDCWYCSNIECKYGTCQ